MPTWKQQHQNTYQPNEEQSIKLAVKKKCDNMKDASLCNKSSSTNANTQKLKKAQRELTNAYLKEQTKCIQDQINKIQHSVEDRQSWIAWLTVNEVSKRKGTERAKLKAANQEEQKHLCNENL